MRQRESDPLLAEFADVDSAADRGYFINYLDRVNELQMVTQYKRLTYALLEPGDGARLLDVGCGTGDDVRALAERVGSVGRVVGVDVSESMVAEAAARSEGSTLPVEFHLGDASALEYDDASFDGCRADRVFQHLSDPTSALAELMRVCRPGGRIVISDSDWETIVVDAPDRPTTRTLMTFVCDSHANGWAAHQLPGLLKRAGATALSVTPITIVLTDLGLADTLLGLRPLVARARTAGIVSQDDADRWLASLEEADANQRFLLAFTGFVTAGTVAAH
jgi:ubiquinone/menaquinone biosynthesis C-methylase UbiE